MLKGTSILMDKAPSRPRTLPACPHDVNADPENRRTPTRGIGFEKGARRCCTTPTLAMQRCPEVLYQYEYE